MTLTPLASFVIAVSLATAPTSLVAQDTKAPAATALDDATVAKVRQAYMKASNEVFTSIEGGRRADPAKLEEALAPKRAAICAEFGLDPATMTVAQIETLSSVFTPELAKAADARLASLASTSTEDGFAAAIALAGRSDDPDAYAKLFGHAGLDAFVAKNGVYGLARPLAQVNADRLRPAAVQIMALGGRFEPTVAGTMGIAGYMKMMMGLGDAVDPQQRESLRQSLVAKTTTALAEAETIADSAKRKEAVDRLKRSLKKLEAAPMKGSILDRPAPPIVLEWAHDSSGPVKLGGLGDLSGKIVILDFWATWCGPCVASFPNIRELRAHYSPEDVVIIGVTSIQGRHYPRGEAPIDCSGDPAKEQQLMVGYIPAMEITWPVAYSTEDVFNPDYDVDGIPHLAIVDAKGTLRHNGLHPAMAMEEKTKLIDALLVEAGKIPPPAPAPKEPAAR